MTRTRRATALSASLAAVTILAGTAGAQAAGSRPVSAVRWHKLSVVNGWRGEGGASWAVKNGVVYLTGVVYRTSGVQKVFAVLPSEARPARNMWITVYTQDSTVGTLHVNSDGSMSAYSSPPADAANYTSLGGVSFPAKSMSQKKISLINGWHSEQSSYNSGNPSYSVSNGVVYLSGSLATSGSSDKWAVLPKAARPKSVEWITVYTYGDTSGWITLYPNGNAYASGLDANSYTSLASVSYPAKSATSHNLTLLNGWYSEEGSYHSGDPAYSVKDGVVYLSGSMATSSGDSEFAMLPASARPKHTLLIKVYTDGGTFGTLQVDPTGEMYAYDTGNYADDFTSLAAVSYPLGS